MSSGTVGAHCSILQHPPCLILNKYVLYHANEILTSKWLGVLLKSLKYDLIAMFIPTMIKVLFWHEIHGGCCKMEQWAPTVPEDIVDVNIFVQN
jgi:hypothetical protein